MLELVVGNQRGKLVPTNAPEALADALFDGDAGDCGLNDLAGNNPPANTEFWIRVDSAIAIDDAASDYGDVEFTLEVRRWTGSNCTGSSDPWDEAEVLVSFGSSPSYDWKEIDPWDTYGILAITPAANTYDSWEYVLTTKTVIAGGADSTVSDSGCFNVLSQP